MSGDSLGRNVFVSYKYADSDVRQFRNSNHRTTVRDYVNVISKILENTGKLYFRGEHDGEDLSDFNYKTIERKLADKIFYTSVTIVLISPRMFENVEEIEQWIPWEISYSLRNKNRSCGNSNMNAILAVVLPDRDGRYDYAMYSDAHDVFVKEDAFFEIILANMFNRKWVDHFEDDYGNPMYVPGDSYIALAKWSDFHSNPEHYIGVALKNRGEWDQFNIVKTIDEEWIS